MPSLEHGTELHSSDLCVAAVLAAVKDVIGNPDWASLRKRISADKVKDSYPTQVEDKKEGQKEPFPSAPSPQPATRVITKANFKQALEQVFPSYSEKAQDMLYKWHEKHSPSAKGAGSERIDAKGENP